MKTPDEFNISKVYAYGSSADLKNYYNDWAHEYDSYTVDVDYILPKKVAEIFCSKNTKSKTVLDIGCGTGLLGVELLRINPNLTIDGIDISESMLDIAKLKKIDDKTFCYKQLYSVDIKNQNNFIQKQYDAIVSSGTFTLGHLNAQDLYNCFEMLKPEGFCAVSVKSDHFELDDFAGKLDDLEKSGEIKNLEYIEVNSYNSNYDAKSIIVIFLKSLYR